MTTHTTFFTCMKHGATLAVSLGSAFFVSTKIAEAQENSLNVFIRTVQTSGDTASEDFIEIQNNEDCALDLSKWKLRKRTSSGNESSIKVFGDTSNIVPPGATLLWANSANGFASNLHATESSAATLTDNNSLALLDANDILIDSLSWGVISKPFRSSEPNVRNLEANEMIVRTSKTDAPSIEKTSLPTGQSYTHTSVDFCGVSKDHAGDAHIVLSEILANPTGDESKEEFIELENRSGKRVDLSKWTLRDASKTGGYIFPAESTIEPSAFLTLFRPDFVFALNNSHETVTLEDATGTKSDSVSWDTTREDISLARDGSSWRNTKFLTPGKANRFGNDPSAKTSVPKKGFAKIPLEFTAKIRDKDRDETRVVWDFGDGHKSYKENTTHAFVKAKRYTVKLTYTDGIIDKTKTFHVKIEKYVAPKVRIVSLMPNPQGADTNQESILIQNKSKKIVNLKKWSIATKSKRTTKNFTNHVIREDFILKPGESKTLTHKESAFTLGNTRQYIELRDPQGKTLQHIHYKLDKDVPDNAEFFKMPNSPWQWKSLGPVDTD